MNSVAMKLYFQGDFCTYMQLELQERDDVAVNSKKVINQQL